MQVVQLYSKNKLFYTSNDKYRGGMYINFPSGGAKIFLKA